jgi:hypothetical protein
MYENIIHLFPEKERGKMKKLVQAGGKSADYGAVVLAIGGIWLYNFNGNV